MSDKDKKLDLRGYLVRALKRWWLATPFERAAFARERRLDCVNVGTACAWIVKGWQPRRSKRSRAAYADRDQVQSRPARLAALTPIAD